MNCKEFENRVCELCDGDLRGTLRREAETHADGCAKCRRLLERHRALAFQLTQMQRVAPPPETTSIIMAAVRDREQRLQREKALQWGSIAATVIAGFLAYMHGSFANSATSLATQLRANVQGSLATLSNAFNASLTNLTHMGESAVSFLMGILPGAAPRASSAPSMLLFCLLITLSITAAMNYSLMRRAVEE